MTASISRSRDHAATEGASARRVVGVVGLGRMGSAFARNLIADGHRVIVYDHDPDHVERLRCAGGEPAADLSALAPCKIVITSLPDDDALKAVALEGLVPTLRPGSVHVSMSTVSPGVARLLESEHGRRGQGYVAAPVLGNPDLAGERRLFVLAGGKAAAVARARGLLERLGQRLFLVAEDPGAANLMKLAANVLTAITMQSMGEVLALLRKGGIDPHVGFDVLTNSLFDARVHRTYGGKILEERYRPAGMTVSLAIKDLRLALAEAERKAVPMPTASLVRDRLIGLVAGGAADLDWSALGLLEARDAGLAASLEPRADAAAPSS